MKFFGLKHENCYLMGVWVTFGRGDKNGGGGGPVLTDFSGWGEMIKFSKHIVQKHNQVKIPNLLNG